MNTTAYDQYKQQSIVTLTPGEMIVKLYDEAIKRCNYSVIYLDDKDYAAANITLKKAQDIISYLNVSLDESYSISGDLKKLYEFMHSELVNANIRKDSSKLGDIAEMLKELRDAFSAAEKSVRQG